MVCSGGEYNPATDRFDHSRLDANFSSLVSGMEFKDMKLGSSGLVYAKYGKEIVADVLQTDKDAMVEKIFRKVKLGEKKQETVRMLEYYFYLTSFYPSFVSFFPHP